MHLPSLGKGRVHLRLKLDDGVLLRALDEGIGEGETSSALQHSDLSHMIPAQTVASNPSILEQFPAIKLLSEHFCFEIQQSLTVHVFPGQTIELNSAFLISPVI